MKKETLFIKGIEVVQDILEAVDSLFEGKTVTRFEFGDSLNPYVLSGEYLILEPIKEDTSIEVNDIVLCAVNGHYMTHMVIDKIESKDGRKIYLIGSGDKSYSFGWTETIYAKCRTFGHTMNERVFYPAEFDVIEDN